MLTLSSTEITLFFLSIGILLGVARLFGELASSFNQPAVLGEIAAGIFLGPTILGRLIPSWSAALFPNVGLLATAREVLLLLSVVLFLLSAGLEVELSRVFRQGKAALSVSLAGMITPFFFGFACAWYFPEFFGCEKKADVFVFSLFFATALCISALPVIAKTLMDLKILRTDVGMIVIAAAIFNDLLGWLIFAAILLLVGAVEGDGADLSKTVFLTIAYTVLMLSLGRSLIHRILPWIQAHTVWPGGVLSFAVTISLFGAALTEWIGIHAIFGSFIVGVAIGDSSHLSTRTRAVVIRFISFFFAPLFFAGIGLKVDFIANFDLMLTLAVMIIASFGKIVGCSLGARLGGVARRPSWAIGVAMNARGAMEIILGMTALNAKIIDERMFVSLVVMALWSSAMSGPLVQKILKLKPTVNFLNYCSTKLFLARLKSRRGKEVFAELSELVEQVCKLSATLIVSKLKHGDRQISPVVSKGFAVQHVRFDGLRKPVLAVGVSSAGVDFESTAGGLAHVVMLLVTPATDDEIHLKIFSDIAESLNSADLLNKVTSVDNFTQFVAVVRAERREV